MLRSPRPVELPAELAAALAAHPAASATLAPSHQREYAQWISEAKRPATKAARTDRALAMILSRQPESVPPA
jgi:uncharacterized protein YdeI (YjbR/CyaY-like superfamily)